MKRIIERIIVGITVLSMLPVLVYTADTAVAPATKAPTYDAQPRGPINREEIEKVLDSPDFKQLSQMMGVPIDKMTPEERKALVDDTELFAHQMEQLPPEEQEKMMQDIFSQVMPPEEPAEAAKPEAEAPVKPAVPPVEKVTAPEKAKPQLHKVETGKKIAKKLVSLLEKIELKFNSLLITAPDSNLELQWAQVTNDLPWLVSALHRISNKEKLIEYLASSEFTVLYGQIKNVYDQLKPLNKKFKTPDTAKLTQVSGADASRAQVISDQEKEQSKKAAADIIKILSGNMQAVNYGIKSMLEKYDRETLEAINKEAKQKQEKARETKGAMYRAGSTPSGRTYPSNGYQPSYYDRYPGSYTSPETDSYATPSSRGGVGNGDSGAGLGEKDKAAQEETAKNGGKAEGKAGQAKGEEKPTGLTEKSKDLYNSFVETANEIDKKAEEFLSKYTAVVNAGNIEENQPNHAKGRDAIHQLNEINPKLIDLEHYVQKLLNTTAATRENDTLKEGLLKALGERKNTGNLIELAKKIIQQELVAEEAAVKQQAAKEQAAKQQAEQQNRPQWKQLKDTLSSFVQGYEKVLEKLQTSEMVAKKVAKKFNEQAEEVNKFIGDNQVSVNLANAQLPVDFKRKLLQEALNRLKTLIESAKKLKKESRPKDKFSQGNIGVLKKTLQEDQAKAEAQKIIPAELRQQASDLLATIDQL